MFDAPAGRRAAALDRRVRTNLARLLGTEPVIVYRSIDVLRKLVARAPFGALTDDRSLKLYVMFVVAKTKRRPQFPLQLSKEGLAAIGMIRGDVLIVSRRKPNGWYGFPTTWIERELGIVTTARSWSTIARIVALAARAR
jgi:uncharacterized protein (DUF1697 family)